MSTAEESTAREQSHAENSAPRLVLEWVWPTYRRQWLQGARLELGRDPSCNIYLPGNGVSRAHAELYRQGPLYVLHDLGSTNGTWLGGKPIEYAPVEPGSVMRIGSWVGVFAERLQHDGEFGELASGLFGGPELAAAIEPLRRAATANLPLLLLGATGSGKERVARAVHDFSGLAGPFVALNCAALPEHLAEAELFGYRRGAFTGAERPSLGYFRSAHTGSLFLDEMPELSLPVQAKLLRVLQDGQVQGLGESTPVAVAVRIIAASQAPLRKLVANGKLRQDLAARLSGIEVSLPALRARRTDVAHLFSHFLQRYAGGLPPAVDARLIEALCLHNWPDNVRELELLTRRLLAVHGHESTLRRKHLPPELAGLNEDSSKRERSSTIPQGRREHDLGRLKAELERNGGNVKAAALELGISRQRIYRLMGSDGAADADAADDVPG